jgi:hypothetical protein
MSTPRTCRVCGCTDDDPCLMTAYPTDDAIARCHWIEWDLCSACGEEETPAPPLLYGPNGEPIA